ncbi:MAG: UDP-3-O-acyl-N-acetylglucosamine deacetylase [Neisseriaceae bacterium]
MYQRTIKNEVTVTGVGLHSGLRVKLTLKPAKPDQGIVFVRTDLAGYPHVKAHPFLVNDTRLSSTLVDDNNVRIGTIEHLMSAFACFGVDNLIVELSAPEMPIMDGSSNSFLYLLDQAEMVEQNAKKKYIKIKEALDIVEDDKWVKISPYDGYKIKLGIKFDHPLFTDENSSLEIDFANSSYIDEISRARTFAFMYEIENIHKNGLGRGGNLNNAIVINDDDDNVINVGGLRFPDEFVRHKILDAIGDLYIIGHPLIGFFEGYKSGHAINNKLLRKILNTPDSWEYVVFDSEDSVPSSFHHV